MLDAVGWRYSHVGVFHDQYCPALCYTVKVGESLLLVTGSFVLLGANAALLVSSVCRCGSFQDSFVFVMVTGSCSGRSNGQVLG